MRERERERERGEREDVGLSSFFSGKRRVALISPATKKPVFVRYTRNARGFMDL